jgi:hypothetical protein
VGRERDGQRRALARQLLLDLRRVAVALDLVRRHVLVGGDEVRGRARLPPGPRDPGLRVDHHVAEEPGAGERGEREQRRGRIAARVGDEVGAGDRLPVQLGQAVDALAEQVRRAVLPVPILVDALVAQAEVGGEVDHTHATLAQRGDGRRGDAVRPADECGVDVGLQVGIPRLQLQRDARAGMDVVEARAGLRPRGDVRQLEERMAVDEHRGDRAGVPGRAQDGDPSHAARPRPGRAGRRRSSRAAARRRRR